MKLKIQMTGICLAASLVFAGAAFATEPDHDGPTPLSTMADKGQPKPHAKPHAVKTHASHAAPAKGSLASCIEENTRDAEAFCADHQDQCASEKGGVRKECEAEIRGERRSG